MEDPTSFDISDRPAEAISILSPSSHARDSRERIPLGSAKTVLSAELFQRRHALEYAHLHSDADSWELKAEETILEEERRIGRQRREELRRSIDVGDVKGGIRTRSVDGKLPLRLGQSKESGHARSLTEVGLGITNPKNSSTDRDGKPRSRAPSMSGGLRPLSLRSSLVAPSLSPRPTQVSEEQTLEVLVEADTSFASQRDSGADRSIAHSTYSWATSFSGETCELRTAAHYVPSRAVTPDNDSSEVFDSPTRREQRRKRIVAIAHTVRQLEGVGSRELEDPTFYETLQRAWFERFDKTNAPKSDTKPAFGNIVPSPNDFGTKFESESESSTMARQRYDIYNSPPDPDFKTPATADCFVSVHQDYPRPKSMAPSVTSRSVRYSYASTLHDLGVEGMMQGAKLMQGRAWMRPNSNSGTPWGGDFELPRDFRMPSPEEDEQNDTSWTSSLDSPFEYDHQIPARMLRRMDARIERPIRQRVVSDEKVALDSPRNLPSQEEAGQSPGGVGYVNAWWGSTPNSANPTPSREALRSRREDFLIGEDGIVPQTSSPLSSQKKRRAMSTSSAVLEPVNDINPRRKPATVSVTLSDRMFLDTLFRVPSRRRSLSLETPLRQSVPPRLRANTKKPRRLSDPGVRAVETNESVFLSLYRANTPVIHSTTFSSPHPERRSLHQRLSTPLDAPVGNQSTEEDGSIGLESLSLRSISPFPTPPLRSDSMSSPIMSGRKPRPSVPPITTSFSPMTGTRPMLLAPPVRIQSIQAVNRPLSSTSISPVLPFPTPSLNGRPVLTDLPMEVEELEADEAYCGIVSPLPRHPMSALTNSARLHTDHWSSPTGLPASASTAVTAAPARDLAGPQLEHPSAASRQVENVDPVLGVPSRPAPVVPDTKAGGRYQPQVAVMPSRRKNKRKSTMALFWLGFVCPILWLIGAWQTTPMNPDIESRVTPMEKRLEDMSWYRRWTYDRDPYIERCRWAAGVTVPLAIIGGVVAGIVVAVV